MNSRTNPPVLTIIILLMFAITMAIISSMERELKQYNVPSLSLKVEEATHTNSSGYKSYVNKHIHISDVGYAKLNQRLYQYKSDGAIGCILTYKIFSKSGKPLSYYENVRRDVFGWTGFSQEHNYDRHKFFLLLSINEPGWNITKIEGNKVESKYTDGNGNWLNVNKTIDWNEITCNSLLAMDNHGKTRYPDKDHILLYLYSEPVRHLNYPNETVETLKKSDENMGLVYSVEVDLYVHPKK